MRYKLIDHEWDAIRPMVPQAARHSTGGRPSFSAFLLLDSDVEYVFDSSPQHDLGNDWTS